MRPSSRNSRILVDDTSTPSAVTAGMTVTVKPRLRPRSTRVAPVPVRPCPKLKSWPTTTWAAPSPATSTWSTKASGSRPARAASKGSTTTKSAPASPSSSTRRASGRIRGGASAGAKKRAGWGSKVSAPARAPRAPAWARAAASSAWCPRCTPSKLPMAIAGARGRSPRSSARRA